MEPNFFKIREAILLTIFLSDKQKTSTTQYDIVKTIFLADKAHLNNYGRPITYDNYVAMKHGPVPSACYDFLKGDSKKLAQIGGALWSLRGAPEIAPGAIAYFSAARQVDQDVLTESDIEEISSAFVVVKSLGFKQIRKLTHEDPAYVDAWEDESSRKQFPMSYALLFESVNDAQAETVSLASKHQ